MTKEQFDTLEVGDKVCMSSNPNIRGYVEDINKEKGIVEFDQEVDSSLFINDKNIIVQKGQEFTMSYYWVKLLEKVKKSNADVVLSKLIKVLEDDGYTIIKRQ